MKKVALMTMTLITGGLVLFTSAPAFADDVSSGVLFYPSFSIRQTTGVAGGGQTMYQYDFHVGYVTPMGIYLGMLFENTRSSGVNKTNQSSIGNSLGYFYGPVSFIATYFLFVKHREQDVNGSTVRFEGAGMQFDLAYTFPIATGLSIGPVLSFRSLSFKYSDGYAGLNNHENAQTYLYPYVGIQYLW